MRQVSLHNTFLPLFYSAIALGSLFGRDRDDILQREGAIPAMEVIKRGGLVLSGDNQKLFAAGSKVTAVYVPVDTRGA